VAQSAPQVNSGRFSGGFGGRAGALGREAPVGGGFRLARLSERANKGLTPAIFFWLYSPIFACIAWAEKSADFYKGGRRIEHN
jgi:hypothetical protein